MDCPGYSLYVDFLYSISEFTGKSKQSMVEDIQHTLTENMASVEGKLDAVSDAGVSLKFAMEQNNVVMIPDLKCRDIDIYSLVQKTFLPILLCWMRHIMSADFLDFIFITHIGSCCWYLMLLFSKCSVKYDGLLSGRSG